MTPNVLIVEARYYAHISNALLDGATAALEKGGAHFERIAVSGAFEIPVVISLAAHAGDSGGKVYDGFVALGCVIRGDTDRFDIVARESARALMDLGLQHHLCIGNGVLAVDSEAQALEWAARDDRDMGGDAARACLALIAVRARFGLQR